MTSQTRSIPVLLNNQSVELEADNTTRLLDSLRDFGVYSVKAGCRQGDCGICTVLIDGKPIRSCMVKTVDMQEKSILTVEGLTAPDGPHPIKKAFMESGAVQCGFCIPAKMLVTKALLDKIPDPSEEEIRAALKGNLCRCTGFIRIFDAIKRAGAYLRGEDLPPVEVINMDLPEDLSKLELPEAFYRRDDYPWPLPPLVFTPGSMSRTNFVGKPNKKVDAAKLVEGKPVYTSDMSLPGMLYASLLTSPHAHALIKRIDASKARALAGVHAVLTHEDLPRTRYASGGQSFPQPLPYDQTVLDNKVRHVGDRVAVVAAESPEIAKKALGLIDVEYEVLDAVIDPRDAIKPGAPIIHDEDDSEGIYDPQHNTIYHIEEEVGDVDIAFNLADLVMEGEFFTPKQHHAQTERHACMTWWDENQRLVVRSSTQVPFHVRRIIAPLIGLPIKQIRVLKPRIGGGFGGKQEILLEDLCSLLTIKTGKPVLLEMSRKEEFISGRSRHRQVIKYKVAVQDDKVTAIQLDLLGDTGAYASHGLTVNMVGAFKGLTLYNPPNARVKCDVVYTNTPASGAFRGYGAMQEQFAIEVLMEEIAEQLAIDVVEFKRMNWLKIGEPMHMAKKLGEGREGFDQSLNTSGLEACVEIGLKATDYYAKKEQFVRENQDSTIKKGIGMAVMFHGSGIAGLDMASATIKMNDDGSFNLHMGAADIGTGSDTILAQIAAEVLQVPVEDFIVHSGDTDFTPFDKGAYASSTTYISGGAVRKTALKVADMIRKHAALMLDFDRPDELRLSEGKVYTPDGKSLTFEEIALSSLHQQNQHQIIASASHISYESPPPTAAQFAEIEVDTESGQIMVKRLLMVVDCGRVINPLTAAGQVEGGMSQGLGFAHTEDTNFDDLGRTLNANLRDYHVYRANEIPPMDVIFVQTDEPGGPFGAKSVSEIAIDGVAPALVSALHHAAGIWMHELPLTPERVWEKMRK